MGLDGKFLVTGGSGFIGRNLLSHLVESQAEISVLTRLSSQLPESIGRRVNRIDCSHWLEPDIRSCLDGRRYDGIIHLASYGVNPSEKTPALMAEINVHLPVLLVSLASSWNAVMIMTGSSAEYAEPGNDEPVREDALLEQKSLYGASKAEGTQLACAAADKSGVPLRVLRLFNVYGPGEAPHRLLPFLVDKLRKGGRVPLSSGNHVRDFVYIKDVIGAILAVLKDLKYDKREAASIIWNVCSGLGSSVRQFAEMVAKQLRESTSKLGFGDLEMRPREVQALVGNPESINRALGWRTHYSLEAGIRDALEHM